MSGRGRDSRRPGSPDRHACRASRAPPRRTASIRAPSRQFSRVPHCCRIPPGCTPEAPAPMPARSKTVTEAPRCFRWKAIERPAMPAPTTMTSGALDIPPSLNSPSMFDYATRQRRLAERMEAENVDVALPGAVGRPRVPDWRRAADSALRRGRVCARLGRRRVLHAQSPDRSSSSRACSPPSTSAKSPRGARDRQRDRRRFRCFERVAKGLGDVGHRRDRRPRLGRDDPEPRAPARFDRLRTGSTLVNELRRVKTPEELAAMGRAIETVEATMAAVGPLVVPGVTMAELVEAVEHELRAAGSRTTPLRRTSSPG